MNGFFSENLMKEKESEQNFEFPVQDNIKRSGRNMRESFFLFRKLWDKIQQGPEISLAVI